MKPALPRPALMLVTAPRSDLARIVAEAVAGGVNVVQWRCKEPAADYEALARELRAAARDAMIVTNGLARPVRALPGAGIHVPEDGPPAAAVRRGGGDGAIIGRSVHSVEAALCAESDGFDYVVAGTIFTSPTHPAQPPAGVAFLHEVCSAVAIPVIAIGGITPANAPGCVRAGAAGVAVLSTILRAPDPRAAAVAYCHALCAAEAEVRR